jgi:hypothetical protein
MGRQHAVKYRCQLEEMKQLPPYHAKATRTLNDRPSAKAVIAPSKHLAQSSSLLNSARYFVFFAHISQFPSLLFRVLDVMSDQFDIHIHPIYLTECPLPLRTSFLRVKRTDWVGQ